jgi:hypothetical protein
MRNRAQNFSVGRLMEFLTALGQDVRITVKPTRKARGDGGDDEVKYTARYGCVLRCFALFGQARRFSPEQAGP